MLVILLFILLTIPVHGEELLWSEIPWDSEETMWEDVLVSASSSFLDYSDAPALYRETIAKLNKGLQHSEEDNLVVASVEEITAVLVKGQVEIYEEGLLICVQGPKDAYVVYYESAEKAEEAVDFYLAQEGVIYAEVDGEIEAAYNSEVLEDGEIEAAERSFLSHGATNMNMGIFLPFAVGNGTGSSVIAVLDSGVASHDLINPKVELGYLPPYFCLISSSFFLVLILSFLFSSFSSIRSHDFPTFARPFYASPQNRNNLKSMNFKQELEI